MRSWTILFVAVSVVQSLGIEVASSPGDSVASSACHMDCFAPLLTKISLASYSTPFSFLSFEAIALRTAVVPMLGV